ncbi:LysR substrate-binding domain-containing protein [Paraburkholderia sp.]|jgi:DNA-binding transcriptional LysR family regulator|uniref:LysR substrate-binding domain-containing protein n=1 Tax=Paraburkholderia sp. TaxID=1926495 RepID=UPI001AACCA23
MMLQEDLDAGRLVRLFPDWPAPTWPVHVVHLPEAHMPPKLMGFIAFLQETLGHGSEPRSRKRRSPETSQDCAANQRT